jgi:hypothetical protein
MEGGSMFGDGYAFNDERILESFQQKKRIFSNPHHHSLWNQKLLVV